jgi:SOUL heme-binding protein
MADRQTNQRTKQTLILPANRPYTQSVTEKLPYSVAASLSGFEIRHYPAYVLVQVKEGGDFESAGSRGFRPLFNYIAGFNSNSQKIAMTAPVLQQPMSESIHAVSFVMPADFTVESLPAPSQSGVTIVPIAEHFAAAIKFSGSWNSQRFEDKGKELLAAVKDAGLVTIGSLYWARFDPPFKPGFMKHNEVLIKIDDPNKGNK